MREVKMTIGLETRVKFSNIRFENEYVTGILHFDLEKQVEEISKSSFQNFWNLFNFQKENLTHRVKKVCHTKQSHFSISFYDLIHANIKSPYLKTESFEKFIFDNFEQQLVPILFNKIDPDNLKISSLSPHLMSHAVFVEQVAKINIDVLASASSELLNDVSFMKRMVEINPSAIQYVQRERLSDPVFMLEMGKISIEAFRYSPLNLFDHFDELVQLMNIDINILRYLKTIYLGDEVFIIKLAKINIKTLLHINSSFLRKTEFIEQMVRINPEAFKYCNAYLKSAEFIEKMAKINIAILAHILPTFSGNPKFMKKMSEISLSALKYASSELKNTIDWWKQFDLTEELLTYIPAELLQAHPELISQVLSPIPKLINRLTKEEVIKFDISFFIHKESN